VVERCGRGGVVDSSSRTSTGTFGVVFASDIVMPRPLGRNPFERNESKGGLLHHRNPPGSSRAAGPKAPPSWHNAIITTVHAKLEHAQRIRRIIS